MEEAALPVTENIDPFMHRSFVYLPNGGFIGHLPAAQRNQHFRETFYLLMQYHIMTADRYRHNAMLEGTDYWIDRAATHEEFIRLMKLFRRENPQMSGYSSSLLSVYNDYIRGLFVTDAATRLVQANIEALTRPKDELGAKIEQY